MSRPLADFPLTPSSFAPHLISDTAVINLFIGIDALLPPPLLVLFSVSPFLFEVKKTLCFYHPFSFRHAFWYFPPRFPMIDTLDQDFLVENACGAKKGSFPNFEAYALHFPLAPTI